MGKILSIVNRKGGVGKTTLTIALAETFIADHRKSVTILDFDPQASASEALLPIDQYADLVQRERNLAGYLRAAIEGRPIPLGECLQHALHSLMDRGELDLAVLANTPELWDVEFDVVRERREKDFCDLVQSVLASAKTQTDIVLIDCPPGRTLSTDQAILASDFVLCPVMPDNLSVWGMDRMKSYFKKLAEKGAVPKWRFVVSKYDDRTAQARRQLEVIERRYPGEILQGRDSFLSINNTSVLRIDDRQALPKRIDKMRDGPDDIKTLQQFYGGEVVSQLRRIAKTALQEMRYD